MKFSVLLLASFFILHTGKVIAQTDALPTKPINSLKANPIELWYSHERNLAPEFTLNIETGFYMHYSYRAFYSRTPLDFGFIPAVKLQGRWYYNLLKRQEKGKNTLRYSANYITLETRGIPGVVLPEEDSKRIGLSVFVAPKWGLRRSLGRQFFFEGAVGYGVYLLQDAILPAPGIDLHLGCAF